MKSESKTRGERGRRRRHLAVVRFAPSGSQTIAILLALACSWPVAQVLADPKAAAETNAPPIPVVAESSPRPSAPVVIVFYNQPIAILRVSLYGYSPAGRVESAERRLANVVRAGMLEPITTQETSEGIAVLVAGTRIFTITPGDLDPMTEEDISDVVHHAVSQLEFVLKTIREETGWKYLLRASLASAGLTLALAGLLWLEWRWWRRLRPRLVLTQARWKKKAETKGFSLLPQISQHLVMIGRSTFWVVAVILVYEWVSLVLRQFPYTRPWGEHMVGYFLAMIRPVAAGAFRWLPDLIVILFILAIAKLLVWLVRMIAVGIIRGRISSTWVSVDAARPTSRILIVIIWLFAVVMLYPYLPGSNSAGFRSVAVFVGLLISLGGTGVIGQIMGGFVLMYTRSLKVGEYVRTGEHEGTVESIGFMSTRLRTRRNEIVNIPNALLMGATTINYSRLAESEGVMASVKLGIGYDVPWRQVEAMLLRAAEKTEGLKKPPEPFVWQSALGDFYVEYELNVCLLDPEQRLPVLSVLFGHIQDEFNEHGVQIMSPHFMANPPEKVWVPRAKWHEPPSRRAGGTGTMERNES